MKKFQKLHLLVIALSILWAVPKMTAQNQFMDHELVCWDSAGIVTPVLVRSYVVNGVGQSKEYRRLDTFAKVVPTVGTVGACVKTDTIEARLETIVNNVVNINFKMDSLAYLLDSIINFANSTQICDCTYSLDLDNYKYSILDNTQSPTWAFDRVITRNCGNGAEIVARIPGSITNQSGNKKKTGYNNDGNTLQEWGYIDSFLVFTRNPNESFYIHLSPQMVAQKYPNLVAAGLDTSDLRFHAANISAMNLAIQNVVFYATALYSQLHQPYLPIPTMEFVSDVKVTGDFNLFFYVTHNPSGFYVAVDPFGAGRKVVAHLTDAGPAVTITQTFNSYMLITTTQSYTLPCGATIYTTYNATTNNSFDWYQIPLLDPPTATLVGAVGTATCTQPCPEGKECLSICDTVLVRVVDGTGSGSGACLVQNVIESPITANNNVVGLAPNFYHSISILIISGTVDISYINGNNIDVNTFKKGQSINIEASACELIQTGFGIDATTGSAIVTTTR